MSLGNTVRAGLFFLLTVLFLNFSAEAGQREGWRKREVNLRMSGGFKITSVSHPTETAEYLRAVTAEETLPYPQPPLAGFSPLIAITTSDEEGNWNYEYEHVLEDSYVGSPLTGGTELDYIIGIFDSGAVVDLIAGPSATTLGIEGAYLTGNTFPIGGVGGDIVDADVSWPIGIFAGSLGAINDGVLDPNEVVGHSNVSVLAAPEISCDNGESITGVVGTPFLSFCVWVGVGPSYHIDLSG